MWMAFGVRCLLTAALGRRLSLRLAAVVALVGLNLLLVAMCLLALRQNVELRRVAAQYLALLTPANDSLAPPLIGEDWTGVPQTVQYQDRRPTLVYTFNERCGLENWRAMRSLQALAPRRLRIVYIDTTDKLTSDYLAEKGIGKSELFVRLTPTTELAYQARVVPQLVLLDRDGRVQWSRAGVLARGDLSEVSSVIERISESEEEP